MRLRQRPAGKRSPRVMLGTGLVVGLLGVAIPLAVAHEERLVVGRVDRIDVGGKTLVVQDPERDRNVRLTIDAETEVRRCRAGLGLAAVRPGDRVRVKYLDRGTTLELLSVLTLKDAK